MGAVLVFVGLLLAACGSSKTSAQTGGPYGGAAPTSTPSQGAGAAVVMTKTGTAGTYLVDGTGKSLYLFVIDSGGKSMCNAACAEVWPPLQTTGKPTAGTGATASMLSTITRDDGSTQVVYNGHPLYYFQGDKTPGDTAGQGVNGFGGLWWLVSPAGSAIQK